MSRPQKTHVGENNELISTREALLRAVLKLVEHKSFDAISLREVTREAGISPAAFYRHFENMEHLGMTIVEESFDILRVGLKEARSVNQPSSRIGFRSVQCLRDFGDNHPQRYRFIIASMDSGGEAIRGSIHRNWKVLRADLEGDLADIPELKNLSAKSHAMIADLMATTMMRMASDILIERSSNVEREAILERGVHQLRLIMLGAYQWREKGKEKPEE